jgi:hypothetical protein
MVRTRPRRDRARHDLEVGHLDPLVAPVADQPDVDQPAAVGMQGQRAVHPVAETEERATLSP